jgi:arylsulfatase A-like enzyme
MNKMLLNIDLAPTFLELAGCEIPQKMQGKSFAKLLKGDDQNWRQSFLYEYFQENYAPGIVTMVGVRTDRYKYIEYPEQENDINELYDLKNDPYEMNNLINNPAYSQKLQELKQELQRLKKETGYDKAVS